MNASLQFAYSVEAEEPAPNFSKYAKPSAPRTQSPCHMQARINGDWATIATFASTREGMAAAKAYTLEHHQLTRTVPIRTPKAAE